MVRWTFIAFLAVGAALLSLSSDGFAENNTKTYAVKKSAMTRQSSSNVAQPSLQNTGTKLPGSSNSQGGGLPTSGSRFVGSQGKANTYGSQGAWAGTRSSSASSQSKGVADMISKRRGTNDQKPLPAYDKASQLSALSDPKGRLGNSAIPDASLFGGERKLGKDGLTSGNTASGTPSLTPATVHSGDGKNVLSRQGMASSGKDMPGTANKYGGKTGTSEPDASGDQFTTVRDKNGTVREAIVKNVLTGETWHRWYDKSGNETKARHTGGSGTKTPAPDEVDESTLPDSLKKFHKEKVKPTQEEMERAKKRQVTLPGENQHAQGSKDIRPSEKDWVKKQTDGRIDPVEGDGTTVSTASAPATDPLTGKPVPGKKHGGGGDPPDTNE